MATHAPSCAAAGVDAARAGAWYEVLRARLTGQPLASEPLRPSSEPTGGAPEVRALRLALLLDEGLPAWLLAVAQAPRAAAAAAPDEPSRPGRSPAGGAGTASVPRVSRDLIPPEQQHEVAMLLATLVLSTRRGGHPRSDPSDHGGMPC